MIPEHDMEAIGKDGEGKDAEAILKIDFLRQSYGAHEVLKGLSLQLGRGEILGVIGENGAGKSTLVKCILGMLRPTSGSISLTCSAAAIHQELNLADDLPVWANFFLGRELRGRLGLLDIASMEKRTQESLSALSVEIAPAAETRALSVSEKQMVEIARALDIDAQLLILDEPSALLGTEETERLFAIMRTLKASGRSMIYISHKLDEVRTICDRVAVLRDGALVGAGAACDLSPREMAEMMVGRPIADIYPAKATPADAIALSLDSPSMGALSVSAGDIVGVAGLADSGQTELAETLAGFRPLHNGSMRVCGREAAFASPRDAQAMGVAFLPPDRNASGVWRDFTIEENVGLGALGRFCRGGLVSREMVRQAAEGFVRDFAIRCGGTDDDVSSLSGGNAQKVAMAKSMAARPKVAVLCEPTQGVDVGARQDIYTLISALAADGMAAIIVSSDMTELIGLCSRIAVMRSGRIAGEVSGDAMTEKSIIRIATGTEGNA